MVLLYFIRSNSFLVFLVLLPILIVLFAVKRHWQLFFSVVMSLALIFIIRFPGFNALNVSHDIPQRYVGVQYFSLLHDIHATYLDGGRLSERSLYLLRRTVLRLDDPYQHFARHWVRYTPDEFHYDLSQMTMREFIPMYAGTFLRNPVEMIRSMLWRVSPYWVIHPGTSVSLINYTDIQNFTHVHPHLDAPDIGAYRQHNWITDMMNTYTQVMAMPIPATLIWRYGFWSALLLFSTVFLIFQKRYIKLILFLPVMVYLASLYLSSGWADYRYGLPVFFVGIFLPIATILSNGTVKNESIFDGDSRS